MNDTILSNIKMNFLENRKEMEGGETDDFSFDENLLPSTDPVIISVSHTLMTTCDICRHFECVMAGPPYNDDDDDERDSVSDKLISRRRRPFDDFGTKAEWNWSG